MEYANVILYHKGKILLQLRGIDAGISFPGTWALPGGAAKPGELPLEAAKREFLEETGYMLHDPQLMARFPYHFTEPSTIYVYREVYDGKQPIKCFEGQRMEFKNNNEILALEKQLFPAHADIILKFLSEQ